MGSYPGSKASSAGIGNPRTTQKFPSDTVKMNFMSRVRDKFNALGSSYTENKDGTLNVEYTTKETKVHVHVGKMSDTNKDVFYEVVTKHSFKAIPKSDNSGYVIGTRYPNETISEKKLGTRKQLQRKREALTR